MPSSDEFDLNFTPPIRNMPEPEYQRHDGKVQIQVMTGKGICKLGYVAMVFHNLPINEVKMPDGSTSLVPCTQMSAASAIEIALNIIYIAKISQERQKESMES